MASERAQGGSCPQCGGRLQLVTDGMVGDCYRPACDYINGERQPIEVRWRLAPFVACSGCEYCCEVRGQELQAWKQAS